MIVSHDREFLARTVNRIVELDLAQQRVGIYDGGYEAYLAEREVARRHAREAYEEYADTLDGLKARAQMQRNWMAQGVRNARRKAGSEPDKNIRRMRAETSEKQASKARQTQRAIERLDVVEEPRKEWELRMTIASAPRSGRGGRAGATAPSSGAATFVLGPVTAQVDWADRVVITGANGSGQVDAARRAARPDPARRGRGRARRGRARRRDRPGARRRSSATRPLLRAFGDAVPDWPESEVRTLLAKFGLAAEHVLRGRRRRCRRASARGRRWRCCRPAR